MTSQTPRAPDHAIDPLFTQRWSPRAFTGEAVPEAELMRMFEAARWAPSSSNSQPWRFAYALRDTPDWDRFFALLAPGNQRWVKDTGAIVVLASVTMMKAGDVLKPSWSHSLDAGAAAMSFMLQAIRQGWHAHAMTGFDKEGAVAALGVPDGVRVEAAYAVGRAIAEGDLTEDQRAKEIPNGRRPITDFVFPGGFAPKAG